MRRLVIRPFLLTAVLLVFAAAAARPAVAWKPSSHVYLAMEALWEIFSTTDRLGDTKAVGEVPIYRTRYRVPAGVEAFDLRAEDRLVERIGLYAVEAELVEALRDHTEAFLAGVVGPDAYPDIATGQQRIHPLFQPEGFAAVPSDAWLRYLWDAAQASGDPAVLAFAAGYLTHAAGDMYMHTFINTFAGGPFTVQGLNFAKHMVAEGYVGKRTPSLDAMAHELRGLGLAIGPDVYDLDLPASVEAFIYTHLVDAASNEDLDALLIEVNPLGDPDPASQTSLPRTMSTLKRSLLNYIAWYDDTRAELVEDGDLVGAGLLDIQHGLKVGYARTWADSIEAGLKAWPRFNHKVMRYLTYGRTAVDRAKLDSLANDYLNRHLLHMAGFPPVVGASRALADSIKYLLLPAHIREGLAQTQEDMINYYLLSPFGVTLDSLTSLLGEPVVNFNPTLLQPDPLSDREPQLISLADFNRTYLRIDDDGFADTTLVFDPSVFEPAYNTITMTKLLLMHDTEAERLQDDLGCAGAACPPVAGSAMLGFINSLDHDNEFREPSPDKTTGEMPFIGCGAYRQLFFYQEGEFNPCPEQLAAPTITPASGVYDTPQQVTISHPDPDVQLYYTVNEADALVLPDPSSSRSHPYTQPFTQSAPFVGGVRPLVILARAFRDGAEPSPADTVALTIDAALPAPTFFPEAENHTSFVNVTLGVPAGSTVFYTVDGPVPDYTHTRYDPAQPLRLPIGHHTIRAVAYRIGFSESPVVEKAYHVYAPDAERAAPPVFTPQASSRYVEQMTVTMASPTEGVEIRYTIAKNEAPPVPTESSTLFAGPLTLSVGQWFLRAIAFSDRLPPSDMAAVGYTVNEPVGVTTTPVFDPPGGTFANDVMVTITAGTDPATGNPVQVFTTTDGSTPATSPITLGDYDGPFVLDRSATVRAQATSLLFSYSDVASATFRLEAAAPTITPAGSASLEPVTVTLATETEGATLRYTLDGTAPTEAAPVYDGPFTLTEDATVTARAYKDGYFFSAPTTATFQVREPTAPVIRRQPVAREAVVGDTVRFVAAALGTPAPSLQWEHDGRALAGATADTLVLARVTLDDAGSYQAVFSNSAGQVASETVALTVQPPPSVPVLTRQPEDVEASAGGAAVFEVAATGVPAPIFQWLRGGVALAGQTAPTLAFEDVQLAHAGAYRAVARNSAGTDTSRAVQLTVTVATGLARGAEIPERFALGQNYPNPFNPTTTIPFALPEPAHVRITLYDVQGRALARLVEEPLAAGTYTSRFDATGLASGVYFYRIEAGAYRATRQLTLVR